MMSSSWAMRGKMCGCLPNNYVGTNLENCLSRAENLQQTLRLEMLRWDERRATPFLFHTNKSAVSTVIRKNKKLKFLFKLWSNLCPAGFPLTKRKTFFISIDLLGEGGEIHVFSFETFLKIDLIYHWCKIKTEWGIILLIDSPLLE